MSDLRHPCERWAEPISLAAAGCLPPDEEREVRRHVETCSDCGERFRQLAQLCGALAEGQLPAESTGAAIVERVMSAVACDESGRPLARTPAEITPPTLLARSLGTWRWIMRSRFSRVAAAAVFILAIAGVLLWFHGGGATYAFADFIAPILDAKTAKFISTTEIEGPPAVTITSKVMVLEGTRLRQEIELPNKSKGIMIFDWGRGKSLSLDPATKKAMVISLANLTEEQIAQQDMFGWFRSVLADALDKPDVKREPLGEMEIDGRRVIGFRVSTKGMVVSLWGDPQTGLPVRAETTMAMFPNAKTTMSDFVFNVELDESQFSTEPPAGYTVMNQKVDASPPEEKDLIETFRIYSELTGGAFPDSLDLQAIMETAGKMIGMKLAVRKMCEKFASGKGKLTEEQKHELEEQMRKLLDWTLAPEKGGPDEEEARKVEEQIRKILGGEKPGKVRLPEFPEAEKPKYMKEFMEASMQKLMEVQMPLQRGLFFAFGLPAEAEANYAGKGVSLGAADTPIFWYRPKEAEKYRVIYADLSVREADAPPEVPNAQPVLAPTGPKE